VHRVLVVVAILGALLMPPKARAQVIAEPAPPPFPDPKKFARGWFLDGEAGALVFLGRAGRYAAAGPTIGLRTGYDALRWMAFQLHFAGASNDANLPPPTLGQTFQTYLLDLEVRLALQLRRFQLYAQAGAGAAALSSNVLEAVGVTHGQLWSVAVLAGGGLDYHTLNRHFSFGLNLDYVFFGNFTNTHALSATGFLKYTQ
jgi:hypothetical protein